MGRNKLGRNDPCHCGSGKKYKKCHLNSDEVARRAGRPARSDARHPVPKQLMEGIPAALKRHAAQEAVRESQQGSGKPIISTEFKGYRFVAVGNTLHWSPLESTQTFVDFLNNYIKKVFGPEWGNAELKKPFEARHPLMLWYHEVATLQQKHAGKPGEKFSVPKTGAVAAYTSLAYNLYLLGHNAEVQEHLLERLKNPDSFYSAYYETYVAAWFILSGFELELENEKDSTASHCEFTATSKRSGSRYSVEAKARQPGKDHLALGNQLVKALRKTANHKRIVFIDMNLPMTTDFSREAFMDPICQRVRNKEDMTVEGEPAPEAYVIVTNIPFHLHLQDEGPMPQAMVGEGFKIPDFGSVAFPSFVEAYKAHEKHADVRRVMDAAVGYNIPETFDGELPEFADGKAERLQIGERYKFDDGKIGTLKRGLVLESSQEVIMVVDVDGQQMMYRGKMTSDELAAYRRHPETFFGEIAHVSSQNDAKTPFDLFLFFYGTYKHSKRENLLRFLSDAPDIEALKELRTEDLALIYCDRITRAAVAQSERGPEGKRPTDEG